MDGRVRGGLRPAANRRHLTTSHTANEELEHHRQQGRQLRPAHHQNPDSEFSDADHSRRTGGSRLRTEIVVQKSGDPGAQLGVEEPDGVHAAGHRYEFVPDAQAVQG